MTKKNAIIIKYCLFSIIIIISSGASVLGFMPFGTALFMSMCYSMLNPLVLSPIYIGSSFLYSQNLTSLIGSVIVSIIFTVLWLINRYKRFPKYVYYIISPFSLAGFVPIMRGDALAVIMFIFFVPIFLYIGQAFFMPLLNRGLRFRPLDHELICGGIILCVLALGLARAEIYNFPIIAVVAAFSMLIAARVYGISGALIVGLCFGIGHSIYDYQVVWMVYYPVMALLAAIFITTPRIISAASVLIGYVLITFFFNLDSTYAHLWLIALLCGGVVYVVIPKKKLVMLKNVLNPDYSPAASRYNINLLRESTARSIFRTGEVFEEMSQYLNLGKEFKLNNSQVVKQIRQEVCSGCNKKCSVSDDDIVNLVEVSVKKGRANVVDLPPAILESCKFSAGMIAASAKIADSYNKKQDKKNSEKLAKGIVSEQLFGVGEVLKKMSDSLCPPLSYDFDKEKKIKEELTYRGIYCFDVVIAPTAITLVVANEHYNQSEVEKVLKKVTKSSYIIENATLGSTGLIIYASKCPAYNVIFAVSSLAKGEVSGDTHSFIKIGSDRFLMALCDGMGSGQAAEKFASGAISLIECFYKAGFDHTSVIKSVNRFLSLSSDEEAFTATDICVLNLNTGVADIFKIGSPACYIKGAETVKTIEGSSLPIGVMDDIRPSFSQAGLGSGDMIVLVSDGVSDCFEGDDLAAEISCGSDISPESLCNQIINAAKKKHKKIRDDMTVAALRIFENI